MKYLSQFLVFLAIVSSLSAQAQHHHHHPPHNMILLGTDEVFASHIVYKEPHNYQVILKVEFDPLTLEVYRQSRQANPEKLYIFLMDSVDIGKISGQNEISGKILFENENSERVTIRENVILEKTQYKILYFDELPLSLEKKPKPNPNPVILKGGDDDCCNMHSPKKGC